MADYDQGRLVRQNKRTVEQLAEEWLSRRQREAQKVAREQAIAERTGGETTARTGAETASCRT